jgi:cysteine desulfurase / selenocysteine lyase
MEFAIAPDLIYLNHAGVAPWPQRTVAAVQAFAEQNAQPGAANYSTWLVTEQRLKQRLARLIHAPSADDVALAKNTSEALSLVAHGLDWRPGDNLVSIAQEFPSNRVPWESLAPAGVELRLLDLERTQTPEQDLCALCDRSTRLISVSSVQYARGLRLDLERIGQFCRRNHILFCVDAIQSLGAVAFDVEACQADFVAADGHKWMLGPEGVALFYSHPEARDRLALHQFGWHMLERAGDYDRLDWTPARSARRFECGSPNLLGIHGLEASLSLIEELGVATIERTILATTSRLIELIDAQGFLLLSPREPSRRAGIITFRVGNGPQEPVHRALLGRGVVCALRGGGIRFSPHYYNTAEQCERALDIAREVVSELARSA